MITRRDCRAVAEYAFRLAESMQATVFGGPKFTVSPVYEGMLKEEMDEAQGRHPDVPYRPELIDATFALILSADRLWSYRASTATGICSAIWLCSSSAPSRGGVLLLSFDEEFTTKVVMAEAPHGTAPNLMGKDVANPMAMILAAAALLDLLPRRAGSVACRDDHP